MAAQYQMVESVALQRPLSHQFENYFPLIYCINLDHRPLRYAQVKQQFHRQQIYHVQRFSAIDGQQITPITGWQGSRGAYGCLQSHLRVVKAARDAGAPNVLIFEDDVELRDNFCAELLKTMTQIPDDWDMLFLGAIHQQDPKPVGSGVKRIKQAYATLGYVVRETVYDAFIALNETAVEAIDINQSQLFARYRCYCTMPHLAWVGNSFSDTDNRQVDHWYIRESLVIFGQSMNQRLAKTCVLVVIDELTNSQDVDFVLRYYREYFQGYINVCVINVSNQGCSKQVNLDCHHYYQFTTDESLCQSQRQLLGFKQAIAQLTQHTNYQYFVFATSEIYIEAMDFRANLIVCDRHDASAGFTKKLTLDHKQADNLRLNLHTKGLDISLAASVKRNQRTDFCYFVAVDNVSNLLQFLADKPVVTTTLDIFYSPNCALQLNTINQKE